LDHDTNADSLLVEVDADVVHGITPSVETGVSSQLPPIYHVREGMPTRDAASTSHSITQQELVSHLLIRFAWPVLA
jgi:hypothetical protein